MEFLVLFSIIGEGYFEMESNNIVVTSRACCGNKTDRLSSWKPSHNNSFKTVPNNSPVEIFSAKRFNSPLSKIWKKKIINLIYYSNRLGSLEKKKLKDS